MDVLKGIAEIEPKTAGLRLEHPPLDHDQLKKAAAALGNAQNPMIFVGSGALNASESIRQLAEMLQAPVAAYRTGRGVMDARHPLGHTVHGVHPLWASADVILAIGSNMRIPLRQWGIDDQMTVIRIDADPTTHPVYTTPDIAITARAEDALPYLVNETARQNRKRADRTDEMEAVKAAWAQKTAYLEPQISYLKIIRDALGEDGILVEELTQVGFAARMTYPVYKPRSFISPGYQGTLGYGYPTALGVKVAKPDAPVISIAGDGGFMFSPQSLMTAVQHRINVVNIVFNNNQYGNVQNMQRELYDGRVIATDLANPDFVKMAESFGAQGLRVETPRELASAIAQGFSTSGPTLIELQLGDVPSIAPLRRLPRLRG